MKEEDIIRRKIAALSDLDLSFNTDKGWQKLDQQRKATGGNRMTYLQRIAALLILVGALWLLASKLAYFRRQEVSENKHLPEVRTSKANEKPGRVVITEPARSGIRRASVVKKVETVTKTNFDIKAIRKDLPRLSLNIKPIQPEFKLPDSVPEAVSPLPARVVHLNDIPRTYLHTSQTKPKVFYVRIGTENVVVDPGRQPKTISYIIK